MSRRKMAKNGIMRRDFSIRDNSHIFSGCETDDLSD